MSVKRLSVNALLTAIALGIFVLEAQLPPLTPVPGIKLGLSNIITLFALVFLSGKDALMILVARVLLGALFSGNPSVLFYSLSGGLASLLAEALFLRKNALSFLWGISAMGALVHNTTQILVALILTGTPAILSYLPILWISGIITGLFTGFCVFYLHRRGGSRLRKLFQIK